MCAPFKLRCLQQICMVYLCWSNKGWRSHITAHQECLSTPSGTVTSRRLRLNTLLCTSHCRHPVKHIKLLVNRAKVGPKVTLRGLVVSHRSLLHNMLGSESSVSVMLHQLHLSPHCCNVPFTMLVASPLAAYSSSAVPEQSRGNSSHVPRRIRTCWKTHRVLFRGPSARSIRRSGHSILKVIAPIHAIVKLNVGLEIV